MQHPGLSPCLTALVRALLAAFVVLAVAASEPARAQTGRLFDFDIPAQPMEAALDAFSEQARVSFLYQTEIVENIGTAGIAGRHSARDALRRLLAGTGLEFEFTAYDTVVLRLATTRRDLVPEASGPTAESPESADQTGSDELLAELVVFGRRRTELLREYAGSAATFDSLSLANARVDGLEDIVNRISNAYFEERPGGEINVFVRGAGTATNGSAIRTDTAIGLYYDGAYSYVQGSRIPLIFYDMERIEVFKGPQGSLYGRNSVGGAIVAHTSRPHGEWEGYGSFEYGEFDSATAELRLNAPIGEDWSARLSGYWTSRESYYENVDQEREEAGDETVSGRLRLRFSPGPVIEAIFGYEYMEEDKGPSISVPQRFGERLVSVSDTPGGLDRRTNRLTLLLTWRPTDEIEIHSITGFTAVDSSRSNDLNNLLFNDRLGEFFVGIQSSTLDSRQFSQDVYALSIGSSPLEWLVGASFFSDHQDGTSRIISGFPSLGIGDSSTVGESGIDMFAAFFDVSYKLTEKLALGGALRISTERRSGMRSDAVVINPDTGQPIPADAFEFEVDYSRLSPSGTLSYFITEDHLVYAKISTGYQSGGINNIARSPESSVFGPSTAVNYEIGARTAWLEGQLTVNLALFRMIQDDYQFPSRNPPFNEFVNAGKARTDGFEIEFIAAPVEWLRIPIAYGFLSSAFIDGVEDTNFGDLTGLPILGIPKHTLTVGVDIRVPVFSGSKTLYLSSNYAVTEGRFLGDSPVQLDDFQILDLRAGFEFGTRYEIHVFAENLFDDIHVITPSLADSAILSPPRRVGIGASLSF